MYLPDLKPAWIGSDSESLDPSQTNDNLWRQAEQLFQNKINEDRKNSEDAECFEMKKQLWLKSCRGNDNHRKTYGSAFVAPRPVLSRASSCKFGNLTEDTTSLLDDVYEM